MDSRDLARYERSMRAAQSTRKTRETSDRSVSAQTIVTARYLGPTDTLGSRFRFRTRHGSKTLPYRHNGHHGIVDAEMRETIGATLSKGTGDTYTVTGAREISGPDPDLTYFVIDYTVTIAR